jgi:hypothetical protein
MNATACPAADPHRQAVDRDFAFVLVPVAMATRDAGIMFRWMRGESRKWRRKARKGADPHARAVAKFLTEFAIEVEDADVLQRIGALVAAADAANASFAAS